MSRSSVQSQGHTSQKRDLRAFAGGSPQIRRQACYDDDIGVVLRYNTAQRCVSNGDGDEKNHVGSKPTADTKPHSVSSDHNLEYGTFARVTG